MNNIEPIFNPKYLNLDWLFYQIVKFFRWLWDLFTNTNPEVDWLKTFLAIVTVFLMIIISYALIRIRELNREERKKLILPDHGFKNVEEKHPRWDRIMALVATDNPSDWRAAIIDADLILEEIVTSIGYQGDNLGEKLKGIESSDFPMLDLAWEAHKIRNRIAHEGEKFEITQREARRAIGLFEAVFRDSQYFAK